MPDVNSSVVAAIVERFFTTGAIEGSLRIGTRFARKSCRRPVAKWF